MNDIGKKRMRCGVKITYLVWFGLVVMWNFRFPNALPYEDVFVTLVLAIVIKEVESRLKRWDD